MNTKSVDNRIDIDDLIARFGASNAPGLQVRTMKHCAGCEHERRPLWRSAAEPAGVTDTTPAGRK